MPASGTSGNRGGAAQGSRARPNSGLRPFMGGSYGQRRPQSPAQPYWQRPAQPQRPAFDPRMAEATQQGARAQAQGARSQAQATTQLGNTLKGLAKPSGPGPAGAVVGGTGAVLGKLAGSISVDYKNGAFTFLIISLALYFAEYFFYGFGRSEGLLGVDKMLFFHLIISIALWAAFFQFDAAALKFIFAIGGAAWFVPKLLHSLSISGPAAALASATAHPIYFYGGALLFISTKLGRWWFLSIFLWWFGILFIFNPLALEAFDLEEVTERVDYSPWAIFQAGIAKMTSGAGYLSKQLDDRIQLAAGPFYASKAADDTPPTGIRLEVPSQQRMKWFNTEAVVVRSTIVARSDVGTNSVPFVYTWCEAPNPSANPPIPITGSIVPETTEDEPFIFDTSEFEQSIFCKFDAYVPEPASAPPITGAIIVAPDPLDPSIPLDPAVPEPPPEEPLTIPEAITYFKMTEPQMTFNVEFEAAYQFTTTATKSTLIMEASKRREYNQQGEGEALKACGAVKSQYSDVRALNSPSAAPVYLGLGLPDVPTSVPTTAECAASVIGDGFQTCNRPFFGVTIDKKHEGEFKELKSLEVTLPKGIELCTGPETYCAACPFTGSGPTYTLKPEVLGIQQNNIDEFGYQTFECPVEITPAFGLEGRPACIPVTFTATAEYVFQISATVSGLDMNTIPECGDGNVLPPEQCDDGGYCDNEAKARCSTLTAESVCEGAPCRIDSGDGCSGADEPEEDRCQWET